MNRIAAVLCALIFAGLSPLAMAADAGLSYTLPTQRTDGTPITPADLASVEIECAGWTPTGGVRTTACPFAPFSSTNVAGPHTLSATLTTGGTAYFRIRVKDKGGIYSVWTNEASKAFTLAPPNPPTNVTVAVVLGMNHAPVYSVTARGTLSTLMGFIPTGRQCGEAALLTYRGAAFHEVQRADVLWWGSTTLRVAAPCRGA